MKSSEALTIIRDLKANHPKAYKQLKAKAKWEHESLWWVLENHGDPRTMKKGQTDE